MNRRKFIINSSQAGLALSFLGLASCVEQSKKSKEVSNPDISTKENEVQSPYYKLSLAQWSIHRMIMEGGFNPLLFAEKAKGWGFEGLEYVNHLYAKELEKNTNSMMALDNLVKELIKRSDDNGMQNLIIMVDGEGDLAVENKNKRKEAVENHYKWVDAAAAMECHSIRVNLFGESDKAQWKDASMEALTSLSTYAKDKNVNVIVENHGGFSSDGILVAQIIEGVGMTNCGTLPDFGNFCLKRENNERWGAACIEEYDKYQGVKAMMPYAKGVSAKTYNFDSNGMETTIDYKLMLDIVQNANYKGFIGVEYEGDTMSEEQGILATKKLILEMTKNFA